jgi:molybdate transport system ATP-binding protein
MTLVVDVSRRLGAFSLDARFESSGRLTAFFGHSGSGKTTLINLIAGLERPDRGRIEIDGRTLVDTDARVFVPTHRRRIGYVFQDARLFPHLTVRQNLAYGRLLSPRADRWADMARIIELLGIGHLLDRRPARLSGGEKSRVAVGRALAASPRLLLMDEPLAALDEDRKAEILPFVERLRDELGIPVVYVSHAIAEVARLATDVVLLAGGRAVTSGPADEVLAHLELSLPEIRDESAALVEVVLEGRDPDFGLSLLRSPAGLWRVSRLDAPIGARLRVRVRARDVMLALDRPTRISALNVFAATVLGVTETSDAPDALVDLDAGGDRLVARVTRQTVATLGLAPGVPLWAIAKAVSLDGTAAPGRAPLSGLAPTGPIARS